MSQLCEDMELLEGFLTETTELLEKMDDDLVTLEKSPDNMELLNSIFRSIHTVKGASSFLGFELLVKITHKTEDVLNRLRKGEFQVTAEIMDVILEAVDLIKLLVNDIRNGEIIERDLDYVIEKLQPYISGNFAEATVLTQTPQDSSTAAAPVAEEAPPPRRRNSGNRRGTAKQARARILRADTAARRGETRAPEAGARAQ